MNLRDRRIRHGFPTFVAPSCISRITKATGGEVKKASGAEVKRSRWSRSGVGGRDLFGSHRLVVLTMDPSFGGTEHLADHRDLPE
jgi:hypothetical protein